MFVAESKASKVSFTQRALIPVTSSLQISREVEVNYFARKVIQQAVRYVLDDFSSTGIVYFF